MTDVELATLAQAGDTRAQETLVGRYAPMVRKWTAGHYLQGAERDDLIQEGMVGLVESVRAYDPALGSFASFAKLCVIRKASEATRAHGKLRARLLTGATRVAVDADGDEVNAVSLAPDWRPSAHDQIMQRDEVRRIVAAIKERLTDQERRAIVGFAFCGESYAGMAGVSCAREARTVDNAVARARKKLREAA